MAKPTGQARRQLDASWQQLTEAASEPEGPASLLAAIIVQAVTDFETGLEDVGVFSAAKWIFEEVGDEDDIGTLAGCVFQSGIGTVGMIRALALHRRALYLEDLAKQVTGRHNLGVEPEKKARRLIGRRKERRRYERL